MNKVILLGNLTRDVELRYGKTGIAIGKTSIATNRKTKNSQTGKYDKDEVMFVDLVIWGRTAEIVQQYFKRGSKILIEGRLSFNQWTDQSGNKRSKHEISVEAIDFPENKSSNNFGGGNYQNNQNQNGGNNYGNQSNQENSSYGNNNYQNQQQNSGGNSNYGSQNNGNYNQQQPAPQNSVPPVDNSKQNIQPKQEAVPEIDINDMDDQVPF